MPRIRVRRQGKDFDCTCIGCRFMCHCPSTSVRVYTDYQEQEKEFEHHIALIILFLAGVFIVLTFQCELSKETLVSQRDAQNPTDGKGCLFTSSVKSVSKADRLHKYAVSTTSAKIHFHSRSCPTHMDFVTGNPVATL